MSHISYSQFGQDLFVQYLLPNNNGFFLELGCGHPIERSNTYILEQNGWDGIMIDVQPESVNLCKQYRSSSVILADLTQVSIRNLLNENNTPKLIDYMSFDVDGSTNSVINNFPFDEFMFKIITFEHDFYRVGDKFRSNSRKIFTDLGYILVCASVRSEPAGEIEDWYVNPNFINEKKWKSLVCENRAWQSIIFSPFAQF